MKSTEKKWARTDTKAKRFRATKSGGPDWNLVTRRMTTNSDTGEIIENVNVTDVAEDFDWFAALEQPTNITTICWYREPSMEEQARQKLDEAADAVNQIRLSKLPDPMSVEHLMTHLPKHPDRAACQKSKLKHAHCRRVPPERKEKITEFGQELSADTLLSKNEVSTSLDGDRFAIIFHDEGTGWLEGAPDGNRNIHAARRAFRNLAGPRQNIDSFYCDNAGELTKAADELEWVSPTSTPFYSKPNSRAERKIGHVKEGTRTGLSAAGMPSGMWNHAMTHFCVSHNTEIVDGPVSYTHLTLPTKRIV